MKANPVFAILLACLLSAASGAGIYYARQIEPNFSVIAGVLLRIAASLTCFAVPLALGRGLPRLHSWKSGGELWLWGIFGVFTLGTYYYAVTMVGAGLANALNAGSGLVLTGLAPVLTRQKSARSHQIAAFGCMIGMILLCHSGLGHSDRSLGIALALMSGVFSALAYLMVARGGSAHSAETVLVHWTAINLLVVGAVAIVTKMEWPVNDSTWFFLTLSALAMAWSQYFTASAYQRGRVSQMACLAFCAPLFSLIIDLSFFGLPFTGLSIAGAVIILIFGLVVPLRR